MNERSEEFDLQADAIASACSHGGDTAAEVSRRSHDTAKFRLGMSAGGAILAGIGYWLLWDEFSWRVPVALFVLHWALNVDRFLRERQC